MADELIGQTSSLTGGKQVGQRKHLHTRPPSFATPSTSATLLSAAKLKDEVVMVGGHLDSWASATGATDNGAGTIVAMEVMRILNALHV
jgi:Iap family predicted aminopeptidase